MQTRRWKDCLPVFSSLFPYAIQKEGKNLRGSFRVSLPELVLTEPFIRAEGARMIICVTWSRVPFLSFFPSLFFYLSFFGSFFLSFFFFFYDSNTWQVHTRVILAGKIGSSAQLTLHFVLCEDDSPRSIDTLIYRGYRMYISWERDAKVSAVTVT